MVIPGSATARDAIVARVDQPLKGELADRAETHAPRNTRPVTWPRAAPHLQAKANRPQPPGRTNGELHWPNRHVRKLRSAYSFQSAGGSLSFAIWRVL
jgi:hypothetical protein